MSISAMLHAPQNQLKLGFNHDKPQQENFIDYLADFNRVCRKTDIFEEDGLNYFVNDYWTSSQRQSNRLHEISYRACFKAELPEFFIGGLTQSGALVYDPFMGRGTTPLQAVLMHRKAAGNDINPLSKMLVKARLNPPDQAAIMARLDEIEWQTQTLLNEELLVFYHPQTLAQIIALRDWFISRETVNGKLDYIDEWIRMVAINRLTGHSPGFFSVYTLPPNQAVSIQRQHKINQKRNQTPPPRDVKAIILKKSNTLLSQVPQMNWPTTRLGCQSADQTNYMDTASVDLVVTSPPFLDVVQYAQDNWLRCWFANIDVNTVPISMHRTISSWTGFIKSTLNELSRIVKPGGHIAFEVGEVRNGKVLLEKHVAQAADGLPLNILGIIVNDQSFTKTANCWGVKNNNRGTNSNRIVLMKRT